MPQNEAAGYVPLTDYLKIRLLKVTDPAEVKKIIACATELDTVLFHEGITYYIGGEIPTVTDEKILAARSVVADMSLPHYMTARQNFLEQSLQSAADEKMAYSLRFDLSVIKQIAKTAGSSS